MDIENFGQKKVLLYETLTEGIMTAALPETEFHHQDETKQDSEFDSLGPTFFRCKEPIALFSNQVTFHE